MTRKFSRFSIHDAHSSPHVRKSRVSLISSTETLKPKNIRWLYKDGNEKQWIPFIGYDSLRIEQTYQKYQKTKKLEHSKDAAENAYLVTVREDHYVLDVTTRKCYPGYWKQKDDVHVTRGSWFHNNHEPIEETYADLLENEHILVFAHDSLLSRRSMFSSVLHSLKFKDTSVQWYSSTLVYQRSETLMSKIARSGLLMWMNRGAPIYRGYHEEATMEDKPPDITHLVFVVHGVGQMLKRCLVDDVKLMSHWCSKIKKQHLPNVEKENKRAIFLPIEWRRHLALDGNVVESITLATVKDLRQLLNGLVMDVMYYSSPIYRSEILQAAQKEVNDLYSKFLSRNPTFEANGGKVSIIAHSLGCLITYDLITGFNPMQRYDDYISHFVKTSSGVDPGCMQVMNVDAIREHTPGQGAFPFKLENFFCLGSPLSMFLSMRGIHCGNDLSPTQILPPRLCKRLYNIYHPSDVVAFRIEPLLLKYYADYHPASVQHCEAWKHRDADQLPLQPISILPPMFTDAGLQEESASSSRDTYDHKVLKHRLDFRLSERKMENSYMSSATSHISYWSRPDVALFIMSKLFPPPAGAQ